MSNNKPITPAADESAPPAPADTAETSAPRFDTLAPNFANDVGAGWHPHGSISDQN